MAYEKTVWKDHVVERPKTYRMVENADDTVTLVPETGQVIQQGTALNAENLNKIEDALEAHETELGDRLEKAGGTMTGSIRMSGNAVQELKEPVSSADAATKAYVDGKRKQFSAALATAWEGAGPFTQTVAVKGILETDMPHVAPVYGDDSDTAASRQEGWSCVSAGKAVPDGILFTCFDSKPDAEIPIQIEVMR